MGYGLALMALGVIAADSFAAKAAALSAMLSFARAYPRFGPQWFSKHAGFILGVLTRRCSGSASPPPELQR